jgi:hypothetical protein
MGNVQLKWAFSEAAVRFLRHTATGKKLLARLEKTHGGGTGGAECLVLGGCAYPFMPREPCEKGRHVGSREARTVGVLGAPTVKDWTAAGRRVPARARWSRPLR